MQSGVGHNNAAHCHRFQPRDRRQRAGAANLNVDGVQAGCCLLCGEFVRNRPARAARDETEAPLQGKIIHLVDHAVDVIGQARPLLLDQPVMRDQRIGRRHPRHQRVDDKSPAPEGLDHRALRLVGQTGLCLAPGIGKKFQRPFRRHRRIQLAQRSGSRVARIDIDLLASRRLPLVEGGKICLGHIDLAAHFHHGRPVVTGKSFRDITDGAGIRGHILPGRSITTRRRRDEHPFLVAQRERQAVDFRLSGQCHFRIGGKSEKPAHTRDEIRCVLV